MRHIFLYVQAVFSRFPSTSFYTFLVDHLRISQKWLETQKIFLRSSFPTTPLLFWYEIPFRIGEWIFVDFPQLFCKDFFSFPMRFLGLRFLVGLTRGYLVGHLVGIHQCFLCSFSSSLLHRRWLSELCTQLRLYSRCLITYRRGSCKIGYCDAGAIARKSKQS